MRDPVQYLVRIARSGARLGDRIESARTPWSRMKGLLGRSPLEPGQGLWLDPCPSVHTFFMRESLDLVFLDCGGAVIRTVCRLPPWRLAWGGRRARSVLELPGGSLQDVDLQPGDRLVFEESGS